MSPSEGPVEDLILSPGDLKKSFWMAKTCPGGSAEEFFWECGALGSVLLLFS